MEHPQQIGKYEILDIAGHGSMGIVYVGHDPFVDRTVAIKLRTNSEDDEFDPRQRKMFLNEARTAGAIDHPNILRVYDAGELNDELYIVMEYVDGRETLQTFCRKDNLLPVEYAVNLLVQCARALAYAHERGVVHRDIKPANIMLTRDHQVKIGDFGIAQRAKADATQFLGKFGSPRYMSPEQVREDVITSQSDLFSFGIVMYEVLTGRPAYAGEQISTLIYKILNEQPPAMLEARPEIPEALVAIVERALEKDLSKRYASAGEIADDLEAVFRSPQPVQLELTDDEKLASLRELRFFSDFAEGHVKEVLKAGTWEQHSDGNCLIAEGMLEHSFYIIVAGDVRVEKNGKEIASLSRGDCFGEVGYLSGAPRSATVTATAPLTVLKVDSELTRWASLPCQLRFNKAFQRVLVERLVGTSERLSQILE